MAAERRIINLGELCRFYHFSLDIRSFDEIERDVLSRWANLCIEVQNRKLKRQKSSDYGNA